MVDVAVHCPGSVARQLVAAFSGVSAEGPARRLYPDAMGKAASDLGLAVVFDVKSEEPYVETSEVVRLVGSVAEPSAYVVVKVTAWS